MQADLERRLAEAEGLLSMAERQETQLVGARVIASPPGSFERQIVIDVGASQGVAPEMAVMNERGGDRSDRRGHGDAGRGSTSSARPRGAWAFGTQRRASGGRWLARGADSCN